MSSTSNSNPPKGRNTDIETLRNFENLPFNFQFPFFHSSPLHTAFLQLPLNQHPSTPTRHYRTPSDTSTHFSSTSPSTTSTVSSLPPLIPNSDISDLFISQFATLHLEEPPIYTPSSEDAPIYESPGNNTLILRRIRILEGESSYILRQIRELRDQAIRDLTADIEVQIREHLARHRASVAFLEGLLTI